MSDPVKDLMLDLVETLDAFDRLEAAAREKQPGDEARQWIERFGRVRRRVEGLLDRHGVRRVNSAGKPFHAEYHEVVDVRPQEGASEGTVLEVLAEAYVWSPGGAMQALRKGQVVVAAPPDNRG